MENYHKELESLIKKHDGMPIIYNRENNMGFGGLEKLHHFDTFKFQNIHHILEKDYHFYEFKEPNFTKTLYPISTTSVPRHMLEAIHTKNYLKSLHYSVNVAKIVELPFVAFIPNCIVQKYMLKPMRYHVAGTIVAPYFALKYGWAICLGGGMHHASANQGGGWCVYSDIPLSIHFARKANIIQKVMVIDLDAHQGNGIERDKLDKVISDDPDDIYIVDMYNQYAFPGDRYAKNAINLNLPINSYCRDDEYLNRLRKAMKTAFNEFQPDIIYYNAGTDIMVGDPLGGLSISRDCCIQRDAIVFGAAFSNNVPIVSVTSGGYQLSNAQLIADSIMNLEKQYQLKDRFLKSFLAEESNDMEDDV